MTRLVTCWRCRYHYPHDRMILRYDATGRHECKDREACDKRIMRREFDRIAAQSRMLEPND